MMLFFMNSMLMISSFIFLQLKHPLAMGFFLLIQTCLISMMTGMMMNSFWFSYILFLVFLGGMLVLFIYVTSLASNEMFNFSIKLMILCLIMMFLLNILILFMDMINFSVLFNYDQMNLLFNNMIMENQYYIYKLYNFPTNFLTCLMINYLFFTLIVVVKVTNFFYGPIRNLN
uniref:NADH dehydrogenase subunit 6 n=1 Tax=Bradysia odoriphaga TaxID=1564500 RepID=UPI001FA7846F|nr:NADH dehydrogenase subunit 6 [Bradysia odoriphaga]UMY76239.1 NADH dehydrogenase subunit 6 [Bradysia odoriphaga]